MLCPQKKKLVQDIVENCIANIGGRIAVVHAQDIFVAQILNIDLIFSLSICIVAVHKISFFKREFSMNWNLLFFFIFLAIENPKEIFFFVRNSIPFIRGCKAFFVIISVCKKKE